MRYTFIPSKDSSIYEEFDWRNAGHDEILEIGKSEGGQYIVRSLLQFNLTAISSSMSSGIIPADASFDLRLFVARADNLNLDQQINICQVSRSWAEGSGYFYQNTNIPFSSSNGPTTGFYENDGVTWKTRQSGSFWSVTGSEYFNSPVVSGTIADPVADMTLDVSSFVRSFVSGTVPNNGLVIKFPDADESDISNAGNIKFFSRQTHTVYSPQLVAKWDNQQYVTGSLPAASETNIVINPKNLIPKYKVGEAVRVDLSVRDRYPLKTFDTVFSATTGNQRLPITSYFSVVDVQSNQTVIPFDNYSKISCDGSGSYFNFRIEGMYPGRYYKVMFQTVSQTYTQIYDSGHTFTIESI